MCMVWQPSWMTGSLDIYTLDWLPLDCILVPVMQANCIVIIHALVYLDSSVVPLHLVCYFWLGTTLIIHQVRKVCFHSIINLTHAL